jgi:LmbE family N-acetylglucosaminyl deacetylase
MIFHSMVMKMSDDTSVGGGSGHGKGCRYHPDYRPPASPLFDHLEVGSNSRVLVLVPHMDDEIMGCGGAMSHLGKGGAHVKVAYMTGAAHKCNASCSKGLVKMDKGEADVALRTLHCFDSEQINPNHTEVKCDRSTYSAVKEIIDSYEPDVIFVPCYVESRVDYMRTASLVARALESYPYHAKCYGYSFEGVSRPDTLVDITPDIDDKIEAMKERRSQVKIVNDEDQIRSTHKYSLSSKNHDRYCERFNIYSKERYIQIARDLGLIKN